TSWGRERAFPAASSQKMKSPETGGNHVEAPAQSFGGIAARSGQIARVASAQARPHCTAGPVGLTITRRPHGACFLAARRYDAATRSETPHPSATHRPP